MDSVGSTETANYRSILQWQWFTTFTVCQQPVNKRWRRWQRIQKKRKTTRNKISIKGAEMVAAFLFAIYMHYNGGDESKDMTHTSKGHQDKMNVIACLQSIQSAEGWPPSVFLSHIQVSNPRQGCISAPFKFPKIIAVVLFLVMETHLI